MAVAALVFVGAVGPQARAQGFQDNRFAIDLTSGPVFGSGRVVGMAGAYGAIATGIDGSMLNPAGYAERAEEEIDWWEWELTGGIWLGSLFTRNDLDNDGTRESDLGNAFQFSAGGRLQFANVGVGATVMTQLYEIAGQGGTRSDIWFTTFRTGGAYALLRGSLVAGAALRVVSFSITDPAAEDRELVSFLGVGAELGALWRPAYERYRASAVVRTPAKSKPDGESEVDVGDEGVRQVHGFVLPSEVHVPWDLDLGFAYQFGERRTNVPWHHTNELRRTLAGQIAEGTYVPPERYGGSAYPELPENPRRALRVAIENDREAERRHVRTQPRRYVLVSGDVLIVGPTTRGQGVAAFLLQNPKRSGARASFGLRVGVETELLQNRLKARAGTYLEPSRFQRAYYRPHGTAGLDVRMFDFRRWSIRASGTIDVAPRYFDWGLSVGLWH